MSDYIVKDTELTSVANAIRTKGGTNSQLVFPSEFVSAIGNISGGGGSSDFSTAEVTFNKGEDGAAASCIIPWFSEEDNETSAFLTLDEPTVSWTVKVPVGGNFITVYFSRAPQSVSGDIEAGGDTIILSQTFKSYVITGECTVNFS